MWLVEVKPSCDKGYYYFSNFVIDLKKFFAFTLAETLIVMGIIGVVAALTLPNLNSSTGNKEKVAKVKKLYSNLNDAMGRAVAVYGPFEEWCVGISSSEAAAGKCVSKKFERITEFMKTTKLCTTESDKGCFANKDIALASGEAMQETLGTWASGYTYNYSGKNTFILADGTSIAMDYDDFIVDIDGMNKGKHVLNDDIFVFSTYKSEVYPFFGNYVHDSAFDNCLDQGLCTAWVINYENMDYLKLKSGGVCPNGTQLSETVTSCK